MTFDKKVNILLVEDDLNDVEICLRDFMDELGGDSFAMHVAHTLAQARSIISTEHIDLALAMLDFALPDGNGLELLCELTKMMPLERIVGVSAHVELKPMADEAGIDFYEKGIGKKPYKNLAKALREKPE